MPVIRGEQKQLPSWCEMEHFEIVRLAPGESHVYDRLGTKEKLILGEGRCRVRVDGRKVDAETGSNLDLETAGARFEVEDVSEPTVLIRMAGRWGEELGGSGLFSVVRSGSGEDRGDMVSYPKETTFDSHFHDCDEFWIIYEGSGTAVSEGRPYPVQAGDCVATGMGHHHDFPLVIEPVKSVFFETTLQGEKRRGHLWNHTHGTAVPHPERV